MAGFRQMIEVSLICSGPTRRGQFGSRRCALRSDRPTYRTARGTWACRPVQSGCHRLKARRLSHRRLSCPMGRPRLGTDRRSRSEPMNWQRSQPSCATPSGERSADCFHWAAAKRCTRETTIARCQWAPEAFSLRLSLARAASNRWPCCLK